jgi:hypothetical protein
MNRDNPRLLEIAQWLVAQEDRATDHTRTPSAVRVAQKLRRPISTLAGASGFHSLLARALSLAKYREPGLSQIAVNPDGSLEGFDALANGHANEAGALLIAQLLGLLTNFIGEPLTLRLLNDAWPDMPDIEKNSLREPK